LIELVPFTDGELQSRPLTGSRELAHTDTDLAPSPPTPSCLVSLGHREQQQTSHPLPSRSLSSPPQSAGSHHGYTTPVWGWLAPAAPLRELSRSSGISSSHVPAHTRDASAQLGGLPLKAAPWGNRRRGCTLPRPSHSTSVLRERVSADSENLTDLTLCLAEGSCYSSKGASHKGSSDPSYFASSFADLMRSQLADAAQG